GLLGVMSPGTVGPIALLVALAGVEGIRALTTFSFDRFQPPGARLGDVVLAMAVLGYVAAHYRLQGLVQHILPPDPRRRQPGRGLLGRVLPQPQPRSAHLATPAEIGLLLLSVPIWALLGQLIWLMLDQPWNPVGWEPWANRLVLLAWLVGVSVLVAASVFGLWESWADTPRSSPL